MLVLTRRQPATFEITISIVQDALVRDIEGGEKAAKQVKADLKEVLQVCNGIPIVNRTSSNLSDINGMATRMSE
jgi:hypothetical protein